VRLAVSIEPPSATRYVDDDDAVSSQSYRRIDGYILRDPSVHEANLPGISIELDRWKDRGEGRGGEAVLRCELVDITQFETRAFELFLVQLVMRTKEEEGFALCPFDRGHHTNGFEQRAATFRR
jgi:hypothetical protein